MTSSVGMPGGSTGKTFVATTVMSLVEDGVLNFDDPISQWFDEESWFAEFGPQARNITIDHLLSHTSGIRDHVEDMGFYLAIGWRVLRGRDTYLTPEQLIGFVASDGLQFAPGTNHAYTDTGYLVLGLVIERVTGRDYYDVLRDRVLVPQGLGEVRPAITPDMPDVALGYAEDSFLMKLVGLGGRTMRDGVMKTNPAMEWTGGGLTTTPKALVDFYHALANGDVVTPESFEIMRNSGFSTGDGGFHYGYGLYVSADAIGHGGWYPGYRTSVRHIHPANTTIAVQTNIDRGADLNAAVTALFSWLQSAPGQQGRGSTP